MVEWKRFCPTAVVEKSQESNSKVLAVLLTVLVYHKMGDGKASLLSLPVEVLVGSLSPFLTVRDGVIFGTGVCKTLRAGCRNALCLALLEREHGVSKRDCEIFCADPIGWVATTDRVAALREKREFLDKWIEGEGWRTMELVPVESPVNLELLSPERRSSLTLFRAFEMRCPEYGTKGYGTSPLGIPNSGWKHSESRVLQGADIADVLVAENMRGGPGYPSFGQRPPALGDRFRYVLPLRKSRDGQRYRLRITGGIMRHHGILRVFIGPRDVLPGEYAQFVDDVNGGAGLQHGSLRAFGDVDWYDEDTNIVVVEDTDSNMETDSVPLAFRLKRSCQMVFEGHVVGKHERSRGYWMCLNKFVVTTEEFVATTEVEDEELS